MTDILTFKSFVGAEAKLRDAGIDDDSPVEITGSVLFDFVRFVAAVEDNCRLYCTDELDGEHKIVKALLRLQTSFGLLPETPEAEHTFSPPILGD